MMHCFQAQRSLAALGCAALALCLAVPTPDASGAEAPPRAAAAFIEKHCADCHDGEVKKGGLDLTALKFEPRDPKNFAAWVQVLDRVADGEMPPKKKARPAPAELADFAQALSQPLISAEQERIAREGRATQRRLNRYEYENVLRDLLHAPWLQVRDMLPEDGEAHRFNKVGDALDMSHVQMARYLDAANYALREVMAKQISRPEPKTTRYYARDQSTFIRNIVKYKSEPERIVIPIIGYQSQPEIFAGKSPVSVGKADPEKRELEAFVEIASQYESYEMWFDKFIAPMTGRYKLRLNTYTVLVGPNKPLPVRKNSEMWWIPDLEDISFGLRSQPVSILANTLPNQLRLLGKFEAQPQPSVSELDVWLLAGETIKPDCSGFYRARQGAGRFRNPAATHQGAPGVAFRWLEVEGPLLDAWPTAGHRLLFGDLPLKQIEQPVAGAAPVEVVSANPVKDAGRLLKNFLAQAYRRPAAPAEVQRFVRVVEAGLKSGRAFADAMILGYTAVLTSPEFVCLEEKPGPLDDHALATRLAFFLQNSAPDAELRELAARGKLHQPAVLRAQTERLLNSPKARQFTDAFLDYWLDLRKMSGAAPDPVLYGDYYLDDLLTESALEETQQFFGELVRADLPARNIVASDFVMVNEQLAKHYGLPPFEGVAIRRVPLPADSPRGGLLTQASVLKVTANGITTSPVLRGAWIMDRILGQPPRTPPPGTPAVESDTRGATTIHQQLDKHRNVEACAVCHNKIDPPGFALENFDVMGGWRDRYRATSVPATAEEGIGHGGQKLLHRYALPVDATGELADGRKFADIREFKRLLLDDETQLARNLARQLTVYATGAPVLFSDRGQIDKILQRASASHYGVRTLILELVQSELFLHK